MKIIIKFLVLFAMLASVCTPGNPSDYNKYRDAELTVSITRQLPTVLTFPITIWKHPVLLMDTNAGRTTETDFDNIKNGVEKKDIHLRCLSNDAIT